MAREPVRAEVESWGGDPSGFVEVECEALRAPVPLFEACGRASTATTTCRITQRKGMHLLPRTSRAGGPPRRSSRGPLERRGAAPRHANRSAAPTLPTPNYDVVDT